MSDRTVLAGQGAANVAPAGVSDVKIPACHAEAARRWRMLEKLGILIEVPDTAENLPDPDYGF